MQFIPIIENKKQYLDLLLLADEQESMIDLYLERGDMYALYDEGVKSICVVTDEGDGICELKNIRLFSGKGMVSSYFIFCLNTIKRHLK